jgi:conjugal transfer pilus assembly protein TraV
MKYRFFLRAGTGILLLSLAACSSMSGLDGSSKFSCAAPKGVACDSVSGNYANAIRNNLPGQRSASGSATAKAQDDTPGPATKAPPRASFTTQGAPDTQGLLSQTRYLRLWIKPWEDIDGDLFDQTYVYVQIDHGRWQIEYVRQAIRDRYAPLRPPPPSAAAIAEPPAIPASRPLGAVGPSGFPLLGNPPAGTAAGSTP